MDEWDSKKKSLEERIISKDSSWAIISLSLMSATAFGAIYALYTHEVAPHYSFGDFRVDVAFGAVIGFTGTYFPLKSLYSELLQNIKKQREDK